MSDIEALILEAQRLLGQSQYLAAFTGAGLSTASGIPDFRSPDSGIWQQVDPMEVASIYSFRQQPERFYNWIRPLADIILGAVPNEAHYALAQMEVYGPLESLITQNIDDLHHQAGSESIYEVHGHFRQTHCLTCQAVFPMGDAMSAFLLTSEMPHCPRCHSVLKPRIILFGENLPWKVMKAAEAAARRCDLMLIAGTSLEVAPAGDLPILAKDTGARLIIVNLQETRLDHLADIVIHGDVVDILPRLADTFQPPKRGKI